MLNVIKCITILLVGCSPSVFVFHLTQLINARKISFFYFEIGMARFLLNLLATILLVILYVDAKTTIEDFKVGSRILIEWNPDKQDKPWVGVKGFASDKDSKEPICELLLNCSRNETPKLRMGIKGKIDKKKGCFNCFKPKVKDDDWNIEDFRDDLHFVYYTAGYLTYCEEPFDQEPKSWYMSGDFSGCLMAVWKEANKDGQMMRRVGHIDTNPDWVLGKTLLE